MTHRSLRASVLSGVRKHLYAIGILAAAALLVAGIATQQSRASFVSAEVQFTDPSARGMHIVPASCPSDMHYVGECGPTPCPPPYVGTQPNCVIPPPPCVAYQGQACTTAGACGTITGAYACDGSCNTGVSQEYGSKIGEFLIRMGVQSCPTCASNMGSSCSSAPNSCGMVSSGAIQCNGTCTASTPSNSLCPAPTGTTCVANTGAACNSTPNMCGMTSPGTTLCSGACSSSAPSNNLCEVTCPEGYDKVGLSCLPPPGPAFEPFTITPGVVTGSLQASGHLEVRPTLIRSGEKARVFWNVRNVRSCTVIGSNNDGTSGSVTGVWSANFSGASGMLTSELVARTTYTLHCLARIGATPSTITETKTVNIIPSWLEN